MKRSLQFGQWACERIAAFVLLLLVGCATVRAAGVVDRIVATVNHRVILESEWDDAVRFEYLAKGSPLKDVTPEQRKRTLDRLIDQSLIEEQMRVSSYVPVPPGEVARQVKKMRESVPAWRTEEGWRASLAAYGLTEEDVEERIAVQINILRYLDLRFRPDVRIDRRAVESYYREQLLPELRRSGAADIPLREVAPKIEQLLIERQLGRLQDEWLQSLRSEADVQVR